MGFFKAYDMRGTFGVDFDLGTVRRVGEALPKVVPGRRWLVGRDCRATSESVRDALVAGLVAAGCEVTDLGQCTTPMVYYYTATGDFDGSVMVTASHNPPGDNGLKVSKRGALPVGYADGLDKVEAEVERESGRGTEGGRGGRGTEGGRGGRGTEGGRGGRGTEGGRGGIKLLSGAVAEYVEWMKGQVGADTRELKFAVDCSNGMASLVAHELFPGAIFLNDTMDGTFACHSPNPLMAEAREQLAKCVRENCLDFGIIFDGDADRAMFVDEHGDFVQPDYLIPVVTKSVLAITSSTSSASSTFSTSSTSPTVIHDVRTSRGAIEALKAMGCEPAMVPVGHAFAKPALRKLGAVCGGELAGHYYFRDFFGCDSGVFAALAVAREIAKAKAEGKSFSQMMEPISGRYANSGEMNFKVADKDATIAKILAVAAEKLPPERSRSTIDGIRLEYAEGWVNVRKSNTEPYLRLIIECDTAERLAEWKSVLSWS